MNFLSFSLVGIFAVALQGGDATLTFYRLDDGKDFECIQINEVANIFMNANNNRFTPELFVSKPYDILNEPVIVVYTPVDHVELYAYYVPRGLSHILDYSSYRYYELEIYSPLFQYLNSQIENKYGNAFTPGAATVAAPEFYFYNLTKFFVGDGNSSDFVPVVYIAPQHERSEAYYLENGFKTVAEFSLNGIATRLRTPTPWYDNRGDEEEIDPFGSVRSELMYIGRGNDKKRQTSRFSFRIDPSSRDTNYGRGHDAAWRIPSDESFGQRVPFFVTLSSMYPLALEPQYESLKKADNNEVTV